MFGKVFGKAFCGQFQIMPRWSFWQKSDEKVKKDPKSFDLESQKVGPSDRT